jgi:hypothetical protein
MKAGDVISESDLIQKGFYQNDWFAGFKVFKRFDQVDEDYTYLFYDFWSHTIQSTLKSKR